MRCAFKAAGGVQCSNEPADARLVPVPGGHVVCLMCGPHAGVYDRAVWVARERDRAAAAEPPLVGAAFVDDVH